MFLEDKNLEINTLNNAFLKNAIESTCMTPLNF